MMDNQLSAEQLDSLMSKLALFAEGISREECFNSSGIREFAQRYSLSTEPWAIEELERWANILGQALSGDVDEPSAVRSLMERGVREFPAILAVRTAIGTATPGHLLSDPSAIEFGILKAGSNQTAKVSVRGVVRKINVTDNRLKVVLTPKGTESCDLIVTVVGGLAGESLSACVLLEGKRCELKVPVDARWERISRKGERYSERSIIISIKRTQCPFCLQAIEPYKNCLFVNNILSGLMYP